MENVYRLKPLNWINEIGLPVLLMAVVVILAWFTAGESVLQNALAIVFIAAAVLHLLFLLRLGNLVYLIPMGFYLSGALTFFSIRFNIESLTIILALLSLIIFLLFLWILKSHKMKWRYREVLELAARSVRSAEDGYTSRPLPAGQIQNEAGEWDAFARFLRKYGIAWPIRDEGFLIFVIPDNLLVYLLGFKHHYQDATYVVLDKNRHISVKISAKTYRQYQQEFTFDKLCRAFGNLFIEFHSTWSKGNKEEIIRKMDDLKFIS
jgi:hypothetical protein